MTNRIIHWLERREFHDLGPVDVAKRAVVANEPLPPGDVLKLLNERARLVSALLQAEQMFVTIEQQARINSDRHARMPLMAAEVARNLIRKALGMATIRITVPR